MLVTDYEEIENLQTWHYVAATQREAVKLAMRDSSIDLSMVAYDTSFNELLLSLYQSGMFMCACFYECVCICLCVYVCCWLYSYDQQIDPCLNAVHAY